VTAPDNDHLVDDVPSNREVAQAAAINGVLLAVCAVIAVGGAVAVDESGWEGVLWLLSYAFGALAVLYGIRWAVWGGR
jgi:hypothetical protein